WFTVSGRLGEKGSNVRGFRAARHGGGPIGSARTRRSTARSLPLVSNVPCAWTLSLLRLTPACATMYAFTGGNGMRLEYVFPAVLAAVGFASNAAAQTSSAADPCDLAAPSGVTAQQLSS